MIERRPIAGLLGHFMVIIGIIIVAFPIYYTFVASTLSSGEILRPPISLLPGSHLIENYSTAINGGVERVSGVSLERMLWNTFVVAMAIAIGKIFISFISAYAIVFFRFPFRMGFFWMIFVTLMLPVEVRILPTYKVIVDLGLIDTYTGLTLPLMASATATFLFRQFFLTIPGELVEAARIDNAGPFRFMKDILLPLSRTNIAALFVILFIYGWTQYLWPLLVTNDAQMSTIIIGLRKMVDFADASTPWNYVMVTAILAIIPPILVVVLMQRWFVKGLVETEK
jgi:sn-glycerol 3-phosphate transport system permease protein